MENYPNKIKPDLSLLRAGVYINQDEAFLKKYSDEDGYCISDEGLKLLKKELSIFAAKDGNPDELSEEESVDFYNKLMSDNDKNFEKVESFEKGKNPVLNWLNRLARQKHIQNEITKATGRNYSFDIFENLSDITDEELNIAKELFKADKNEIYTTDDISIIIGRMDKENLPRIKELMNTGDRFPSISASSIADIASLPDEQYERAKELFNIKNRDYQFSGDVLCTLTKLDRNEIDKILQKDPNAEVYNINSHFIAIKNPFKENFVYDEEYLVFDTETGKQAETLRQIQTSGNIMTEIITNKDNNIRQTRKIDTQTQQALEEIIERYDKNNNLISTEKMVRDKDEFTRNVSITDNNGKQTPVQWESRDKITGNDIIQRNMTSPDGTKTEYYYEEAPSGFSVLAYKITDKDGKVLLNQTRTFQPVEGNPDKFISSFNDRIYEIEYTGNIVRITDKKENKTTTLDLNKITDTQNNDLINAIKKLPGDALIDIAERGINRIGIDDFGGSWGLEERTLDIPSMDFSMNATEQLGIFMHEFGHFLDTEIDSENFGEISQNPEFIKIYNEELENFKKNSTSKMQEYIDYFIDHDGNTISAQSETVAESHKILTSPHTETRTYYLQQNFPRSIAKIAELFEQQQNN